MVYLLQLFDFLQHHVIHAVFVLTEYALCFDAYSHFLTFKDFIYDLLHLT